MEKLSILKEKIKNIAINHTPRLKENNAYEPRGLQPMLNEFPKEEDITIYEVKEGNNQIIIYYYNNETPSQKNQIIVDYTKENEFSITHNNGFANNYGYNYSGREIMEHKIVARPDGGFEFYQSKERIDTNNCQAYNCNRTEESLGERYDKSGIQTKMNRKFFKPKLNLPQSESNLWYSKNYGDLGSGLNGNIEKLSLEFTRISHDIAKVKSQGTTASNQNLNCEGYHPVECSYLPQITHYIGINYDWLVGTKFQPKNVEEIVSDLARNYERLDTEPVKFLLQLDQENDRTNFSYDPYLSTKTRR